MTEPLIVSNNPNNIVIVHPHPVTEVAVVKLEDDFLSNNNVQSVVYRLFAPDQTLIAVISASSASSITEETLIPAIHFTTPGVYFINCTITILKDGGTIEQEVIDVSFIVSP
jgi:hypothetical protein